MKKIKPHLRYLAVLLLVIPFSSTLFVNCSGGFQNGSGGVDMSSSSSTGSGGGGGTSPTPSTGPVGTLPTTTTLSTTTTTMPGSIGGGAITAAHPRIWLADTTNFNRLKAAYAANSAQWKSLQSFCDNTSATVTRGDAYQGDLQFQRIASFALCYQVSGNATYAQKAMTLLTTNDCTGLATPTYGCSPLYFNLYSTDDGYGIRNYVPALALAYDWLQPYMSTAVTVSDLTGKTLGAALIQRMNAWLAWFSASGFCRATDGNCMTFNPPHTGVGLNNYFSGYLLAQSLAAAAVGSDDSSGASLYSTAQSLINTGFGDVDTYLTEGHHQEGGYGSGAYERYAMAATALRWATGNAAFINSKWLMNYPNLKLAAVTNDGQFYYDDGQWHNPVEATTNDSVLSGYTFGWNSSIGQTVVTYLSVVGSAATSGGSWENFLFYDPSAVGIPLASVPKSYMAGTFGVAFMRSDWNSSSASWASLSTARWIDPGGEQYPDAGHVEIYKGSPLLINAGFGDRWGASLDDSSYYNTFTFENRTDGGSRGQHSFASANCPNPLGSDPIGMKKFADGGDYVFTAGEFSAAYSSGSNCNVVPANFIVRNELYVRPDLYFIYDQVSVRSGTPTEHFHFAVSPVASGTNQWTVTSGKGILQIAAISPTAVTSKITSQAISSMKYSDGSDGPQVANTDLAMSATTQTTYQAFLNVFRAGLSSGTYTFPTMQALSPSIGHGVRVSGMQASENATPIVVIFADNSQNSPSTAVQYAVPSSAGAYHYVAMLQPNTKYQVTESVSGTQTTISITPSTAGNVTADASGVARFTE